jgi:uncharacterized protein
LLPYLKPLKTFLLMIKSFFTLSFAFALIFNSFSNNPSLSKGDSIQIKAIPHSLKWETKPKEFKVLNSNSISITAGKETDLFTTTDGNYSVGNVPKLLFTPDPDFIFAAKVKPEASKTYDGGAILVYTDSENWAKILLEKNGNGTMGIWTTVSSNKIGDDNCNAIFNAKEVYLKVAKSDKLFSFYYSLDGKAWTLIRIFPYQKTDNLKIGLAPQSPKGESCKVEFSDITYSAKKYKDLFAGE